MILHVPHASRRIPDPVRKCFLADDADLERELLRMTDAYTDELFERPDVPMVVFPVSRLVVDPERFIDDADEPMARRGMGVIYTRMSDGRILRQIPTAADRSALLERYYMPHHRALERAAAGELARRGKALIVDCHSFPSHPLPCDLDQKMPRPDICLGTDPDHTPPSLWHAIVKAFARFGIAVAVNCPYAGTIVPYRYYRMDSRVWSIMIEVRRGLYMDEDTGAKTHGYADLKEMLGTVLPVLADIQVSPPL